VPTNTTIMTHTTIHEKIEQLPDEILFQVADYIDFLLDRYKPKENSELSKEEIEELENRYQNFKENPESAISWEEAQKKLMAKHRK
jgi:hypothetical protein